MLQPEESYFTLAHAALHYAEIDTYLYQCVNEAKRYGVENADKAYMYYQDMMQRLNMCGLVLKKVTSLDDTILFPVKDMPSDLFSFGESDAEHKLSSCSTNNLEYNLKITKCGGGYFIGNVTPYCYEYLGIINGKEFTARRFVEGGCSLPVIVHSTFFQEWISTRYQCGNPFSHDFCQIEEPSIEHDADLPCFLLRLALDPIYQAHTGKGAQAKAYDHISEKYASLGVSSFILPSLAAIKRVLKRGETILKIGYEPNNRSSHSPSKKTGISVETACLLLWIVVLGTNYDPIIANKKIASTFHGHKSRIADEDIIWCLKKGDKRSKDKKITHAYRR